MLVSNRSDCKVKLEAIKTLRKLWFRTDDAHLLKIQGISADGNKSQFSAHSLLSFENLSEVPGSVHLVQGFLRCPSESLAHLKHSVDL